jgi:hypothetical protein
MQHVIQKTVTTTRTISLTITHSDEAVEYSLTTSADQANNPEPRLLERSTADGVIDVPPERTDGEPTPFERSAIDDVIDMPLERDDGEPTPFNPTDEAGTEAE